MKIIIAEKLEKIRSALRLLIEQDLDEEIVGEASCLSALHPQIRSSQPDLLILEWDLPGLTGADRIKPIRDLCPDLKVIAICSQGAAGEIKGADAVIRKGDPPEQVLAVLHAFCRSGAGVGHRIGDTVSGGLD